jgi:Family of unknown function (DUF6328)
MRSQEMEDQDVERADDAAIRPDPLPSDGGGAVSRVPRSADVAPRGDTGRDETEEQRLDRNVGELLQELRVAGLGVQVLFGFLLSLPFTTRFVKLSDAQRDVYLATLLVAALSIALLAGPVAFHRIVFRRHEKGQLMRAANKMALAGLTCVGLSITGAVLLVVSFVEQGFVIPVIAAATAGVFASVWFLLPATHLLGAPPREGPASSGEQSQRAEVQRRKR